MPDTCSDADSDGMPVAATPRGLFAGVALAAWALLWSAVMSVHGAMAWHFFTSGASILTDLDDPRLGLHLYADAPQLQIGPFSFVVTELLRPLSAGTGAVTAQVFCMAAGLLILWLVRGIALAGGVATRLGITSREIDRRLFLAAGCAIPVWSYVAVASLHLDDVLALTLGVAALWAALRDRALLTGVCVALAIDSKPWALPMVVLILLIPAMAGRVCAALTVAAGVALAWLPFFLVDPNTVRALHYTIANTSLSTLRVLGVTDPQTPAWDRPLQTALGLALGVLAIRRGRWPGALLVIMAVRLALDPGTNRYYTAGLVVGAVIWDVCGSRLRWPVWSLAVLLLLHELRWASSFNEWHGWLLLLFVIAVIGTVFAPPGSCQPGRIRAAGNQGWRRYVDGQDRVGGGRPAGR